MKLIETILKKDIGQFDTPKKINQSKTLVNDWIVNNLEAGIFTSEMLETLSSEFPVFRYKTCVTIHGDWGTINQKRIGGYKNITQTNCGTVEVRWSAIDVEKINKIRKLIYEVRNDFNLNYYSDSNNRGFSIQTKVDENNFQEVKKKMLEFQNRISDMAYIYGGCLTWIGDLWGQKYLCLNLNLLAIEKDKEVKFICDIMGWDLITYLSLKENQKYQDDKDEQTREKQRIYAQKKQDEEKIRYEAIVKPYRDKISLLRDGSLDDGIVITLKTKKLLNNDYDFYWKLYRVNGKGSFGKLQVQSAECKHIPDNINRIIWDNLKQVPKNELKRYTGKILIKNEHIVKNPEVEILGRFKNDIQIISFNRDSIAIIGKTYPVKTKIATAGGIFSKKINDGTKDVAGWIVPIKNRKLLETFL